MDANEPPSELIDLLIYRVKQIELIANNDIIVQHQKWPRKSVQFTCEIFKSPLMKKWFDRKRNNMVWVEIILSLTHSFINACLNSFCVIVKIVILTFGFNDHALLQTPRLKKSRWQLILSSRLYFGKQSNNQKHSFNEVVISELYHRWNTWEKRTSHLRACWWLELYFSWVSHKVCKMLWNDQGRLSLVY